ncbi:hypothetical protein [Fowlpox virus]|nr:hypothetical protein [Fowlpox virus]
MEKELLQLYESLDDEKCKDLFARQLIICHRHMHMHMDDMWSLIGDALRGLACSGYCPTPNKPATEEPDKPSEPEPEKPEEPGTDKPTEPGSEPTEPGEEKPPTKDDSSGTGQPTDSGKPTPDPSKPDNGSGSRNGNTGFNTRPDIFRRNF